MLTYVNREAAAIRSGRWKRVGAGWWSPVPGLYDLEADPGETIDLTAARPDLARQLAERRQDLAGEVARRTQAPR